MYRDILSLYYAYNGDEAIHIAIFYDFNEKMAHFLSSHIKLN